MLNDIKEISIKDERYPEILKEIKNPPKTLYIRGEIFPKEDCFAIVGTRKYTSYGKQIALEIAGSIAEKGLTIVSGLAPGIDTFSHQAAVERKKRTIAVLGTGLDEKSIYPKENIRLAREILEQGGALISEYPSGTQATKFSFPNRNRIVSGLSLGILVIEAKEKSGALITAEYGFEQKKKIFAVPGSIYSLNSKGCHFLIKKGAKLVENADDILKDLNLSFPNLFSDLKFNFKQEIAGESEEEKLILSALENEALDINKIIEKTKLSARKTAAALAVLEIKNKVKNLGGNIYAISIQL